MHGDVQNKRLNLISALNDAIEQGAKGHPEALKSIKAARQGYKEWAQEFKSPYIRHLRDIRNEDFNKIFNESLDFDQFNVLRRTLEKTPRGRLISNQVKVQIAKKELKDILKNIDKLDQAKLDQKLRHLGGVLSKVEISEIREFAEIAHEAVRKKGKGILVGAVKALESGRPIRSLIKQAGRVLRPYAEKLEEEIARTPRGKSFYEKIESLHKKP